MRFGKDAKWVGSAKTQHVGVMQGCLYQNTCWTDPKPCFSSFWLKMYRHASLSHCMKPRLNCHPHWFHLEKADIPPWRQMTYTIRFCLMAALLCPNALQSALQQTGHSVAPHSVSRWGSHHPAELSCSWLSNHCVLRAHLLLMQTNKWFALPPTKRQIQLLCV